MDTYVIEKAYHWANDTELSITSENLTYVELGTNRHGGQTNTNNPQILKKCAEICDLIREIEELNNGS